MRRGMSSTASPQQPVLTDAQVDALCAQSADRLEGLRASLRAHGSALVAFSGGVDSALVLKLAVEELGERAVALTALSASVAPDEAEEARSLARQLGARHVLVDSKELDDPRYAANPSNRCYFCKTELYAITSKHRADLGLAVVLDGFNADDKKDHRPGHKAARRARGALARWPRRSSPRPRSAPGRGDWGCPPGTSRRWPASRRACPTAPRSPSSACVRSARAEKAVRDLGFVNFRVRYHQEVARLELGVEELGHMLEPSTREAVNAAIKAQGFTFVALDLEPFRSGRLNDVLKPAAAVSLPVLG